ncbi:WxL domain-containing protein [Weissella cibaria]|mgnify:FL=1|uniref:WxL domain-containing protein n=1 Tax=Weissella cibaria TaxID=137591 RepID=UPI0013694F2A|nr:WxL domain-containing protein [Weissella cibaria]MYV36978.1 hypothetical protein [Weissella cibaria]
MIKQLMLGAAVLAGVVGVSGGASAAETFTPGTNDQVATNQGTTKISLTGDTTTSSLWENPNGSGDGQKATENSAGKKAFGLVLVTVPSFNFGEKTLTGQATESATATGTDNIKVQDLRYDENGYKVFAAASKLVNEKKTELPVTALTLSVLDGTQDENGGQLSGTGDTPATILDANKATSATGTDTTADTTGLIAGHGNLIAQDKTGNADGTYESGAVTAKLDFGAPRLKTGNYTGKITYTLQDDALK